jgi:Raf kinase inhibitor-like YbhB/YbcL family protein
MTLTSPAFGSEGMIPERYARDGEDISPPLEWGAPPPGTQSFALLVESDPLPDGGSNWVQWILYNIPAETRALPEAVAPDADGGLPDGSQHGENSWGQRKYGGPNPPHVSTFGYYFRLYALDTGLDLDAVKEAAIEEGALPWIGASKYVLRRAMEGHILAEGLLVGTCKGK